jgi:site-specific recombinase XerD
VLVEEFVRLKRVLGHRYDREECALRQLVRFLAARRLSRPSDLSRESVEAFACERRARHPRSWRVTYGALSVFCSHLKARGLIRENPCAYLPRPRRPAFCPYLFPPRELRALFFRLPQIHPPAAARALVYRTIFAGALRVSEALRLRVRNFDPVQETLFIEKTKFGKDRLVPGHPQVAAALADYVRSERAQAPPDDAMFVNRAGRPWEYDRFRVRFQEDLIRLGISGIARDVDGVRHGPPCFHSLRHTFAVRRLLAWYRAGADVQAKLPLLTTFLGHAEIRNTQVYLTISPCVLREAHGRFAARWQKEFPLAP